MPFQVRIIDDCWYFIFLVPNGRFDFAIPINENAMFTEALNLNVEQSEALTIFLNGGGEN